MRRAIPPVSIDALRVEDRLNLLEKTGFMWISTDMRREKWFDAPSWWRQIACVDPGIPSLTACG